MDKFSFIFISQDLVYKSTEIVSWVVKAKPFPASGNNLPVGHGAVCIIAANKHAGNENIADSCKLTIASGEITFKSYPLKSPPGR